jgi:hypothetical protein
MIISIRIVIENERVLNKEKTTYDFVFDAHTLVVRYY